jgi:hypothetical protein
MTLLHILLSHYQGITGFASVFVDLILCRCGGCLSRPRCQTIDVTCIWVSGALYSGLMCAWRFLAFSLARGGGLMVRLAVNWR